MKLYMTPGACSTGIHILLEEIGLLFEVHPVNLPAGEHRSEAYLAINPKGTIPTLVREDGSALTDFQSIAWWLARTYPEQRLLPSDPDGEAEVLSLMGYAVNMLHAEGFARLFVPDQFALRDADHEAIKQRGREIVARGFAYVDDVLKGQGSDEGSFTIADAALFYVMFWADRTDLPMPPHCQAHYRRLLQRPAVRQVLMEEGYGRVLAE